MVEYTYQLDSIFQSLADATRRDILRRVAKKESSIGEIAKRYKTSFAAIAKHVKVLEQARLITKHRRGKQQIIRVAPQSLKIANHHLEHYKSLWESRFQSLDQLLKD